MSPSHWFKVHMAAYKRPATVEVRKKSHRTRATSQTPQKFLSLFSYNQNSQNSEKLKNTKNTFSNPNSPELNSSTMQWNLPRFSEIHHRIIITEPFPLQFKRESTAESSELNAITEEEEWEEEGKNFKRFEPVKKKKRNHQFIFGIQAKNQQNRIRFKNSWRFQFESPNKTQVNTWTYFFLAQEHQQIQNRCRSVEVQKSFVQNWETLKTFENRKDSTIYNEYQPL